MVIRAIFMGTPRFAVPSLSRLLNSRFAEVKAVFTQPDRKAGRGRKPAPPPVKVVAEDAGIPVFQPERLKNSPESLSKLVELDPDVLIVVAFGQILPPAFFEHPRLGAVNLHASLLPRYRGAAPIIHSILNGDTKTGVTIMKIDEGMDSGDILSQLEVQISSQTTAGELEQLLSQKGAELLEATVRSYAAGEIEGRHQDHSRATLAPRISRLDARVDWKQPAARIHDFIRAFNPRPGAWTPWRDEEIKLWRSEALPETALSRPPGTVVGIGKAAICVHCGDGTELHIKELQRPGKARVSAVEFANGARLEPGERFG